MTQARSRLYLRIQRWESKKKDVLAIGSETLTSYCLALDTGYPWDLTYREANSVHKIVICLGIDVSTSPYVS